MAGFKFDFLDQLGPLLQEAMQRRDNEAERQREEARWQLQFEQKKDEFNRTFQADVDYKNKMLGYSEYEKLRNDEYRNASLDQQRRTELANITGDLNKEFMDEDEVRKILGQEGMKGLTPYTAAQIEAPYEQMYKDPTLNLIPQDRNYYRSGMVQAAKLALDQSRLVDKMTPRTISNAEYLPKMRTINEMEYNNTAVVEGFDPGNDILPMNYSGDNILRNGFDTRKLPPTVASYVVDRINKKTGVLNDPKTAQLFRGAKWDPTTKRLELSFYGSSVGGDGLPAPVSSRQEYDKGEVDAFFRDRYPGMLESLNKMDPAQRKQDAQTLIGVGGALSSMAEQYPQYAQMIQPFSLYSEAANVLRQDRLNKVAAQQQSREMDSQIRLLKMVYSNAKASGNEKVMQAIDSQLMQLTGLSAEQE